MLASLGLSQDIKIESNMKEVKIIKLIKTRNQDYDFKQIEDLLNLPDHPWTVDHIVTPAISTSVSTYHTVVEYGIIVYHLSRKKIVHRDLPEEG